MGGHSAPYGRAWQTFWAFAISVIPLPELISGKWMGQNFIPEKF